MYGIEETIARNGSTKADIEGGSFQIVDGVRVPIFAGVAGEQIDSQEHCFLCGVQADSTN